MRWGDKRYYSLDTYYKKQFGCKVYKLPLNGGMTCPNRDGTLDTRGCIFCSEGGSGEFAASALLPIQEQLTVSKQRVANKVYPDSRYIAYFQAFTNTYAPVSYLERIFQEAMEPEYICGLSVATRPDCLGREVLSLLEKLNKKKPVYIELGLQTIHEGSATLLRRGYSLPVFLKAVSELSAAGIAVVVHLILGLPYETPKEILESVQYVSHLPIHGLKLQLLHILKGTDLAEFYQQQFPNLSAFHLLEEDAYIDCLIRCIEQIPPELVLHRLTGDGPKSLLLAPLWSANKKQVLNQIHQELAARNTYQGRKTL